AQSADRGIPGEAAETEDDPQTAEKPQFGEPPVLTGVALGRRRFIRRRGAADGGGNVAVFQFETVTAADGNRAVREPGPVQGGEEKVAGTVAGEHPAGAVAAVGR